MANTRSRGKIDIIDFFTNKKVSEIDEAMVLKNKSIDFIKKLIVKSYPENYTLIHQDSIALGDGSRYITDAKQITKGQGKIAVFNLLNEITGYVFENAHVFIDDAYEKSFINFHKSLSSIYTGLSQEFLRLCVAYLLFSNTGMKGFKDEAEKFTIIVKKNKEALEKIKLINEISPNLEKVFVSDFAKFPIYFLTNSLLVLKLITDEKNLRKETLSGFIIKNIELDETIVAMASKDHGVKSHKSLDKKLVNNWFLEDGAIKNIRGLTIKIKADDYEKTGDYYNLVVSNTSMNASIRLNWPLASQSSFIDIYKTCAKSLGLLFQKFADIGVFLKEDNLFYTKKITKDIIYSFVTHSSLTCYTKDFYQIKKLSVVERKFPQFIREESSEKVIKLNYKSPVESVIINIRPSQKISDGIVKKVNAVEILGATPYSDLGIILGELSDLFVETIGKKVIVFEDGKLKELEEPSKEFLEKKISKKNIKVLGEVVDSVSCQKKRQPVLQSGISPKRNSKSVLSWKGKTYNCDNPEFPYPGFTSKRSLCCFTKSQKNKEIYKTMMTTQNSFIKRKSSSEYPSDNYILENSRVIKNTGSVIQPDKLGEVSDKVKSLLGFSTNEPGNSGNDSEPNILRLGVKNGENNKQNIISGVFRALNLPKDGEVYKKISSMVIENQDFQSFLDNIRLVTRTNIVILERVGNTNPGSEIIVCGKDSVDLVFEKTMFLLKSFEYIYDIIVFKKDSKTIQKMFDKKSNLYKSFYKNYKQSCGIEWQRYNRASIPTIKYLLENGAKITHQISNKKGNIIFVNDEKIGIVPVVPYNYIIPGVKVSQEIKSKLLHRASEKIKLLKSSGIQGYNPVSFIKQKGNKNNMEFIVLESGIPVPVIPGPIQSELREAAGPMYYGIDVENVINFNSDKISKSHEVDYFDKKAKEIKFYRKIYGDYKASVIKIISEESDSSKKKISELLDNDSKKELLELLLKITEKNIKELLRRPIDKKIRLNYTKRLINEMGVDKVKILNGTWSRYPRNKENFLIRGSEIILVTPEDIRRFIVEKKSRSK